jgi:hypothetical protein
VADRGKLAAATAAVAAAAAVACEHQEITYYPRSDVVEDIAEGDVAEPDATAETNVVGLACAEDTECGDGFCVTKQFLTDAGANPEIDVPGGMCTAICASDEECGPGATCFEAQILFGAPFNLCLRLCDGLVDCRWEEAWSCFEIPDDEAAREVCLSDSLIVAVETDPALNPPAEE